MEYVQHMRENINAKDGTVGGICCPSSKERCLNTPNEILDKLFLPQSFWELSNWGKYFQKYFAELHSEYAQILRKLQHLFRSWLQILSYFRHYDSYDDDDDDGTADEVERANVLTAPKTVLPEWAEWKWDPLEPFLTLFPFQ